MNQVDLGLYYKVTVELLEDQPPNDDGHVRTMSKEILRYLCDEVDIEAVFKARK